MVLQLAEAIDQRSKVRRYFRFRLQDVAQSFADLLRNCATMHVVNIEGAISHNGTLAPMCPTANKTRDTANCFTLGPVLEVRVSFESRLLVSEAETDALGYLRDQAQLCIPQASPGADTGMGH
jgi:hypothetical protein